MVSHAGGVLLTAAIERTGLDVALRQGLSRWRRPQAVHDPAKVVLDLAVTLALGGDCLPDVALLRSRRQCSGQWPRTRPCPARSTPSAVGHPFLLKN